MVSISSKYTKQKQWKTFVHKKNLFFGLQQMNLTQAHNPIKKYQVFSGKLWKKKKKQVTSMSSKFEPKFESYDTGVNWP